MYDLVIHRCAEHARIIEIALERGLRAQVPDGALRYALQIHGRNTRCNQFLRRIQYLTHDAPATAHFVDLRLRLTDD